MTRAVPSVSRVGIVGDVHAEDVRLARGLDVLARLGVDAILCVGDVVDGPGDVARCFDLLLGARVETVIGNHERWFLANEMRTLPYATLKLDEKYRGIAASWPKTLDFDTPRGRMRLAHGVGDDDMAELRADTRGYALQAIPGLRDLMLDPSVIYHVGGHTHERMSRAFPGLVTLNAGTISGDDPTVMHLDFEERKILHVSVATDDVKPIEELVLPEPLAIPA